MLSLKHSTTMTQAVELLLTLSMVRIQGEEYGPYIIGHNVQNRLLLSFIYLLSAPSHTLVTL